MRVIASPQFVSSKTLISLIVEFDRALIKSDLVFGIAFWMIILKSFPVVEVKRAIWIQVWIFLHRNPIIIGQLVIGSRLILISVSRAGYLVTD